MESTRLQKVNQLLQEDLAEIFRQEAGKIQKGMLISVTEVRTTPDLSIAKVFLSVFPTQYRDDVMKNVSDSTGYYRRLLGQQIGSRMRIVPELHFYADISLDRVDEIEKALKGKGENPVL
ncbi:MAG: 30S ribosome-binding factor RbfA [Flavobacteriaceae bacterium]|nr:30S ribosome-binding factor RbfA [Flavobacteriaceae bacterium]